MSRDRLQHRLRQLATLLGADIDVPRRRRQIAAWLDAFGDHPDHVIDRAIDRLRDTCEREWPRYDQIREALREAPRSATKSVVSNCPTCAGRGTHSTVEPSAIYGGRCGQPYAWRCHCPAGDAYPAIPRLDSRSHATGQGPGAPH